MQKQESSLMRSQNPPLEASNFKTLSYPEVWNEMLRFFAHSQLETHRVDDAQQPTENQG